MTDRDAANELRHMSRIGGTHALAGGSSATAARRDDDPVVSRFSRKPKRSFVGRTRLERDAISRLRVVERRLQRLAGGDVKGATVAGSRVSTCARELGRRRVDRVRRRGNAGAVGLGFADSVTDATGAADD